MVELISIYLILNTLIFINFNKISKLINIFDKPDNKLKKHKINTPLLGGVIMLLNLIVFFLLKPIFEYKIIEFNISYRSYFSIIFFILSFFLIGIIDDKHKLKPEKKIFFMIFFSIISLTLNNDLLISDFSFSFYEKRIFLHDFKYVFTIFCILILINSLNFYDGINAQSIIFFIFCFAFLSHKSVIFNFYMIIILVLIFILLLNLLNKCFMGDNGIYLLGSILIISIIYEHNIFKTIDYSDEIFLLLILPGFDLVRLTFKRLVRNKNVFYGDRNHIHHILHNKFSLLNTNLILLFLGIMPIFLYSGIKLNFFIVITIFIIAYILAINIARSND